MSTDYYDEQVRTLAHLRQLTENHAVVSRTTVGHDASVKLLVLIRIADQLKRLVDMAESAKLDQDGYQ